MRGRLERVRSDDGWEALAERVGLSTAATTLVVDRLERAGLVRRERDPDDRRTVTDNGPGLSTREPRSGALGLRAVRRRLELRCPGSVLRLQSSSEGTSAVIEVPVTLERAA